MNAILQKTIITSILIFILTGCTTTNQNLGQTINSNKRAITGGAIGSILGAVIGHQVNSKATGRIIGNKSSAATLQGLPTRHIVEPPRKCKHREQYTKGKPN